LNIDRNIRYEDIVDNIKKIISVKGVKQRVVAERAGFSQSEFSNILNGRRKLLRVEHILPIAKALDVDVNTLYYPPKEEDEENG